MSGSAVAVADAAGATRRQIRGSSLLLVGRVVSLGIGFAVQVLIVRYLTKSDYGAFAWALSIVTLGETIAILGLDRAVSRFVPIYEERREFGKLFGTFVLVAGTIVSLGLALMLVVIGVDSVPGDGAIDNPHATVLLAILIVLAPIQALDNFLLSLFAIFAKPMAIFLRKHVLAPGFRLVVVLLLVLTQSDVDFLAIGYVAAGAIGVAIYLPLLVRALRDRGLFAEFRRSELRLPGRELFGFALPLLALDALHVVTGAVSVIILANFSGSREVAEFQAILPAARLNLLVMTSFALLFTPVAARLFAREDRDGVAHLYWQTAIWMAVCSFPVFAVTFALAEPVTVGLFGERYRDSATFLMLISLGYYFSAALGFNGVTLRVYGLVKYVVVISLAAAAFNLVLNFALIPPLGALGAAIAMAATLLLHNVLKQVGLRRGTGISMFASEHVRLYAGIGGVAAVLVLAVTLSPRFELDLALAALATLLVVSTNKRALRIGQTFPELARMPLLRRLTA